MFQPAILHPEPDPNFVRELLRIDTDLRVVWGYERYLMNRWIIERRMPPDRYFAAYSSFLESGAVRYIEQPIFDDNRPIYANEFERECESPSGYEIVGYHRFDLAPEYEWVMTVKNEDDSFRPLDQRTITEMKRAYAWDRFHSLTRLKMEKDREREERDRKAKTERVDACMDEIQERRREIWDLPFAGQPKAVLAGTEID